MFKPAILGLALLTLLTLAPAAHAITQTVHINKTITFYGFTVSLVGDLTVNTDARTLNGQLTLTVKNAAGVTLYTHVFDISKTFATSEAATLALGFLNQVVSCHVSALDDSSLCGISGDPDVNHDGRVTINDLAIIGAAYGSTPGSANWNPAADLNGDGRVTINDVAIAGADYGTTIQY